MICKQCHAEMLEESKFCHSCGAKAENEVNKKFCFECGSEIIGAVKFCPRCGKPQIVDVQQSNMSTSNQQISRKFKGTYPISIISAIISFIVRIAIQDTYYTYRSLLDNRKVVGIDSDVKPFLTVIPIIAAIIVILRITKDKNSTVQEKVSVLITNFCFIALALLFIWFDLPYSIIDF